MFNKLIATNRDPAALVVRLALGIMILPHGAQKLLGWLGGPGFDNTMHYFTTQLGIPAGFAFLAIVAEFLGGLGLITGLLTRVAAFGVACVMLVAVAVAHSKVGFFMNWSGQLQGEGYEFHILAVGLAIAAMIRGGGLWSLDGVIANKAGRK